LPAVRIADTGLALKDIWIGRSLVRRAVADVASGHRGIDLLQRAGIVGADG